MTRELLQPQCFEVEAGRESVYSIAEFLARGGIFCLCLVALRRIRIGLRGEDECQREPVGETYAGGRSCGSAAL
jgi:hypothetical protein